MTLLELKPKIKGYVKEVTGGSAMRQRLIAMGIYEGCEIEKKSGLSKCPVIIEVCGCIVALGRGMAGKIIVKTDDCKM